MEEGTQCCPLSFDVPDGASILGEAMPCDEVLDPELKKLFPTKDSWDRCAHDRLDLNEDNLSVASPAYAEMLMHDIILQKTPLSNVRIAVAAPHLGCVYSDLFEQMLLRNYSVDFVDVIDDTPQGIVRAVKGYDAVIAGSHRYNRRTFEMLSPYLRIIAKFGSGYDSIDLDAATDLGIAVTNAPDTNSLAVAEHALSLMLCLTRRICTYDREVRLGVWKQTVASELYGKTVGIVGFGNIGRRLAQLLTGFSCRILVFDKVTQPEMIQSMGVEYCDLDTLARQSDFISLHLPLIPETEGMLGMDLFLKMKSSAFLINTSRGQVVREKELIEALRNGILAGAGLDVYTASPLESGNELCTLDSVILTPHTAAHTDHALREMMQCCLSNIVDFFKGTLPPNLLNPEYGRNAPQGAGDESM